ncbi:MAG TPA: sigma-70 family RNA polymerase sigma factor, partial [Planctomycetota bacterium]|nr:sigma-70 family RNA polymerase sigma factor [Planctomycetota bacterium]
MPDPRELDLELCQHATALRSIARDLVRDPHAADDVTQETLHRAMSRPPRHEGPIGGWLYRTLVNFAHQWRRSERRLAGRHAQLPPPEPATTPPDTLCRRETLRAVTNAVLALDEPYQTAIFLRYFEDLPPRAICRRTGANLATVKSRLQRGLVLLRARLDRQCGDREHWRTALLITFGLPLSTAAAAGLTATTGAWILGTSAKTLIAAGLLCAGGLFAFTFGQDPPPLPTELARQGDVPAVTPATTAAGDEAEPTVREAAANANETSLSWLDHPYLLELDALVVDETGLPVEGHVLRLAPPGCTLNDAKTATGPDGRVTLSWRSRVATCEMMVADERGTLRRVTLQHGRRIAVALAQTRPKNRYANRSSEGTLKIASRETSSLEPGAARLALVEFVAASKAMNVSAGMSQGGLHPHAVFGDNAAAGVVQERQEAKALALHTRALLEDFKGKMRVEFGPYDRAAETPSPPLARIAGTVFGEDGKPVAGAPVALLTSSPQPLQRTQTDDAGQFVFEKLLPGDFTVRAGGTAAGLASLPVVTTTG